MTHPTHYQIEISGETATLYVLASLTEREVETVLSACRTLPMHVRRLRIDLQALGYMTADALDAVRRILRHWRSTRRGEVRLHTSHLVATCSEVELASHPVAHVTAFAMA